jgi:hypothetical protein
MPRGDFGSWHNVSTNPQQRNQPAALSLLIRYSLTKPIQFLSVLIFEVIAPWIFNAPHCLMGHSQTVGNDASKGRLQFAFPHSITYISCNNYDFSHVIEPRDGESTLSNPHVSRTRPKFTEVTYSQ